MVQRVRWAAVAVAIIACAVPAAAQRSNRRVYVSLTDSAGAPITDLTAADFTVTENGTKRQVVRAAYNPPQRILLVVDTSSAMQQMLNDWRSGLLALLDAVPGTPEIGLVTVGGPLRPRVPPMADRQKLVATIKSLASDSGANTFFESLLEADRRFMAPKPANNAWPVFVILLTDHGDSRMDVDVDRFNAFVTDLTARGANAHAIVVRGKQFGVVNELAENLVGNLGGIFEALAISTAVPEYMKTIGARLASDAKAMAGRYEVEFQTDPKAANAGVEVEVNREGARLHVAGRRP